MANKLTEAQRALLQAGALRNDRCIEPPSGAKGAGVRKSAIRLMEGGFAKELKSKPGMPIWRADAKTGKSYAVKLTAAGMKAAAIQAERQLDVAEEARADKQPGIQQLTQSDVAHEKNIARDVTASSITRTAPRDGTKLAKVLTLLQRAEGATIEALVNTTGWLPHTTRAALTGLRKRGFQIVANRSEEQRASVYRVVVQKSETGLDPANDSVETLR